MLHHFSDDPFGIKQIGRISDIKILSYAIAADFEPSSRSTNNSG